MKYKLYKYEYFTKFTMNYIVAENGDIKYMKAIYENMEDEWEVPYNMKIDLSDSKVQFIKDLTIDDLFVELV